MTRGSGGSLRLSGSAYPGALGVFYFCQHFRAVLNRHLFLGGAFAFAAFAPRGFCVQFFRAMANEGVCPIRSKTLSRHADIDMQCLDNPLNRVPLGLSFAGQGFVEALPVQAGVLCQLGNAFMFGEMAQRNNEHIRVFIQKGLRQVLADFFIALKKIQWVIGFGFGFHWVVSQVFSQLLGFLNVARLARFIATTQQNDQLATAQREIQPVTLTDENPHFADTIAQAFDIAQIAFANPIKPTGNGHNRLPVFQVFNPGFKNNGGLNFVSHEFIVACGLQNIKPFNATLTSGANCPHRITNARL
ncbi:MAG: hypothetical protein ACR2HF_11785 [Methylococcaceae bacterium]